MFYDKRIKMTTTYNDEASERLRKNKKKEEKLLEEKNGLIFVITRY